MCVIRIQQMRDAAAYLGSEIKKPDVTLPKSLILDCTFLVTSFYLLLNVVYIYSLPQQAMAGVIEIGAKSVVALFGEDISKYFNASISLALLSVLSAMIMTGPRVYYAMAKDRVFFRVFRKDKRNSQNTGTFNRIARGNRYTNGNYSV